MVRSTPPRLRDDGGAVVVEAAIVMPLLLMLVAGIIDYGGAFRYRTTVQSASRNASRAGATASGLKSVPATAPAGTQPVAKFADQLALSSLAAGLSGTSPQLTIIKVIIYRANSEPTGKPPQSCIDADITISNAGVSGVCNVYTPAKMATAASGTGFQYAGPDAPSVSLSCPKTTNWDAKWCPLTRKVDVTTTPPDVDRLGVYVEARYTPYTRIFGNTIAVSDFAVMAVEPNPRN